MKEKKKINWLLILQGWAMLWVVIGHSPLNMDSMPKIVELAYNFAYSFHMPLFILVSGYLFQLTRLSKPNSGGGELKSILSDKIKRLGIPFLVFTALAFVLKFLFSGDMNRTVSFTPVEIIKAIANPFEGPLNEMWFIMTIMWFFVLTPLWKWSNESYWRSFVLFIILLFLNCFHPSTNWLSIRQACHYGLFFFSGIIMCRHHLEDMIEVHKWKIMLLSIVLYLISYNYKIPFLATWSAIFFSFAFIFICDKYLPNIFSSFRGYTYQIFLIGIFAQIAVKMIFKRLETPYYVGFITCIFIGIYVPVLISRLVEKLKWKPFLICLGLK